jgi:hypothetical protein
MSYVRYVLKILLIVVLVTTILPAISLTSLDFVPRIPESILEKLTLLLAPSTYVFLTLHAEIAIIGSALAILGFIFLSDREVKVEIRKLNYRYQFSKLRGLASLFLGYWLFTFLSYQVLLNFGAQSLVVQGLGENQAYTILEPVTTVISTATAFVIRIAITRRWKLTSGPDPIRIGEFLLLVVYTDIVYRTLVGETNLVFLLTFPQPGNLVSSVIWAWVGTFLISVPFALADKTFLSS